MDTEIKSVSDIVGEFKAIRKELGDNAEANKRAAADFADKLRAVEMKQALSRPEPTPSGSTSDLIARTMRANGTVRLAASSEVVEFAGQRVKMECDGLFSGPALTEWDAEVKQIAVACTLFRQVTGREPVELKARLLSVLSRAPTAGGFRDALSKSISDTASSGAEWIPDMPIASLYEDFYSPNGVAALFGSTTVRGPILVPSIVDVGRPYLKGKATNDDPAQYTASTPTSGSTTIEPVGFAARMLIDDAATEDAIFALAPEIQRRAARAIEDGYEDCILNGDTAATHQDTIATWNIRSRWGATGLGSSADHRRGFIGLRAMAYDRTATVDLTATQTAAGVMGSVVGAMGELAASDIALITSPEVLYTKLMVDSNVLTVDKMGSRATIIGGQLASIGGHPLITSRWMGADLHTDGLYTGSSAKSGLVAVSRGAFQHYVSRNAMVEQDKDITRGVYNVVATRRSTFRTLSASTQKVVFYAFNML